MICCTEEQWVDYCMGAVDWQTEKEMAAHLSTCRSCQALEREWRQLLGAQSQSEPASGFKPETQFGDKSGSQAAPEAESALPRTEIRQSLRKEVRRMGKTRRLPKKRTAAAAAALGVLCALLLFGLNRGNVGTDPILATDPLKRYIEQHEPQAVTIVRNPRTVSYRIVNEALSSGYIWINSQTKEAFILLEEPPAFELQDYQAWAVRNNHPVSMGLFQIHDGRAHLYVKETQIGESDNIVVSTEPKGGSTRPTAHETIIFVMP